MSVPSTSQAEGAAQPDREHPTERGILSFHLPESRCLLLCGEHLQGCFQQNQRYAFSAFPSYSEAVPGAVSRARPFRQKGWGSQNLAEAGKVRRVSQRAVQEGAHPDQYSAREVLLSPRRTKTGSGRPRFNSSSAPAHVPPFL